MSLNALIIGGGIGGLCLAQGLKRAGIRVSVFERDRTRADRLQGFHILLDPDGSRSLHHCLPQALFEAFVSICGKPGKGLHILTSQLREIMFHEFEQPDDPVARHRSISRIMLRQVLLAGLTEDVFFDKRFSRYDRTPDGRVVAYFEDGSTAEGNVLVGADGVNSRVRQLYLPDAQLLDTEVTCVTAKVPLTSEFDRFEGANTILGGDADGMFIARQELEKPIEPMASGIGVNDCGLPSGMLFDNAQCYLFWAYMTRQELYQQPLSESLSPEVLLKLVEGRTGGWHPEVRALIQQSDPQTVAIWNFRTSVPIDHWQTSNITLLGDAIHSMTPARGLGANVALRDADLLRQKLIAADGGDSPLLRAIEEYELEMMRYGFRAVRESALALEMFVSNRAMRI